MNIEVEECCVCLCEFDNNRYPIMLIPCKHSFCTKCIALFEPKECPLCRVEFHSTQTNSLILKNSFLNFLHKMEEVLDEHNENSMDIHRKNKKTWSKLLNGFEECLGEVKDEFIIIDLKSLFKEKLEKYEENDFKFYAILEKYRTIKSKLRDRVNQVDLTQDNDKFTIDNEFLEEILEKIEYLINFERIDETEVVDIKGFFEIKFQDYVNKVLKDKLNDLELKETQLEVEFGSNKQIYLQNLAVLKEISSKLGIDLANLSIRINSAFELNEISEEFIEYEQSYNKIKEEILKCKTDLNFANICIKLDESKFKMEKENIEKIIEKIEIFLEIKLEKIDFSFIKLENIEPSQSRLEKRLKSLQIKPKFKIFRKILRVL